MYLPSVSSIIIALSFSTALLASPTDLAQRQSTVRIMALGDSITGSPGCWRAYLWQKLQQAGIKNTDFVGTLPGQGCGFTYDGENEGHGGYLAVNIASQNLLPSWLSSTKPDIILMHLGTNDVWNNQSPTTITSAFSTLLSQMLTSNPRTKLLVAKIIPMAPSNCAACGARVVELNKEIERWAGENAAKGGGVAVVDTWTGFDTQSMTGDGVHPNEKGGRRLADVWYPAVAAAIRG